MTRAPRPRLHGLVALLAAVAWWALAAPVGAAPAAPSNPLEGFLHGLVTLKAGFSQEVVDDQGQVVQKSSGVLYLKRPDRFRWDYRQPPELIVADGKHLWFYDSGLQQVTVRPLEQGLGDLPVALLTSNRALSRRFRIEDLGRRDGRERVRLTPRSKESGFEWIRVTFRHGTLEQMELRDSLGQTTRIRFSDVERNPKLSDKLFRFTPPPGVDVVGER